MIANIKMKRLLFNITGTCTGGRCVGWNAINSMWATTYDIDKEFGTDYHDRLKTWLINAQKTDITIAGALTDPKGDRTLNPCQQPDPDMNLHIVEKREDGIIVRGAKVMICGVAAANEIFILPGMGYKEPDKDYALSFVIPRDIENFSGYMHLDAADDDAAEVANIQGLSHVSSVSGYREYRYFLHKA